MFMEKPVRLKSHLFRKGSTFIRPVGRSYQKILPAVIVLLGFSLSYVTYSPGLVPVDAQDQLHQAQTGVFSDWHPAVVAAIWSLINHVVPGPKGFFLLELFLFWGGLFLLLKHLSATSRLRFILAAALPFSPLIFNFIGTIWKDVFVFDCFILALGIALLRSSQRRISLLALGAILLLLILGSLARYNSVLAAGPLLVFSIWPRQPDSSPLKTTFFRLIISSTVLLVIWASSNFLLNKFIHAERLGVENSLFVWDIVGVSHQLQENLLPGPWSKSQSDRIVSSCYEPSIVNSITIGDCDFIYKTLKEKDEWRAQVLMPLWAKAVLMHPGAYLRNQTQFIRSLFWPNNVFVFDADDGANEFNNHQSSAFEAIKGIMLFSKTAPFLHFIFTVGFWICASGATFFYFSYKVLRGSKYCYTSALLAGSAVLYVWPLVVIGVAGDLRYAYWAIAAVVLSWIMAGNDISTSPSVDQISCPSD